MIGYDFLLILLYSLDMINSFVGRLLKNVYEQTMALADSEIIVS